MGFEAGSGCGKIAFMGVSGIKESPAVNQVMAFATVAPQEEPTSPQLNELRERLFPYPQ